MKYRVKEFFDYVIDNPHYIDKSFKERAVILTHRLYKYVRIKLKRVISLKAWQTIHWRDSLPIGQTLNSFSNNSSEEVYFNTEHLHYFDYFPKEKYSEVVAGVKKFYFCNRSKAHIFDRFDVRWPTQNAQELEAGFGWSSLCSLAIGESSPLHNFVSHISFSLYNITSSYCGMIISVTLSQELTSKFCQFALSSVPDRQEYFVPSDFRWSRIRFLGVGQANVKSAVFHDVLDDIIWRVSREVAKSIESLILHKEKCKLPTITTINTNTIHTLVSIHEKDSDESKQNWRFWSSIGVMPNLCYFFNNNTACISLGERHIVYLYSADHTAGSRSFDVNSYIAYGDIGQWFCSYLLVESVTKNMRRKLSDIQSKMPEPMKRTKKWIKLRLMVEQNTFYEKRFISEYKKPAQHDLEFIGMPTSIVFLSVNCEKRVFDTMKLFGDVTQPIIACADSINTLVNYKMQYIALWTGVVSVLIAIIALLIAFVDSENVITLVRWVRALHTQ